ncbi:hypothetical protein OV090_17270 [Nannocystis sp. RBIL2]|uniref:hypothetical protein n=1 Tax=Nannocystis sp. RBIL2 TaxID=2996788 RepID=UPI002271AE95|nr:hypothetical protein [Nannocystis sp. RBIL2]MCY1066530.1 hypothetical protein [Nannocystis sp. RBIL2]
MQRHYPFALVACLTLGLWARPEPAAARSCAGWSWIADYDSAMFFDGVEVPVDVLPWMVMRCEDIEAEVPDDCALVSGDTRIDVTVELSGGNFCTETFGVVAQFVPAEPLMPGAVYKLDCGAFAAFPEDSRSPGTLHVREDATPAAPPEALGELDAHEADPETNSCGPTGLAPCKVPGYIALSIDFSAQYFAEGGYVEAAYADGQLMAVSGPFRGDEAKIPPGPAPIALTPVAADGTRGATLTLTEADIASDPDAGSGCRMGGGGVAPALWLLGPLAWTFTRRRRR